jgi:type II secretion system protein N
VSGRRRFAIALAAIALTGFFLARGFPYEPAARALESHIERQSGWRVAIEGLGASLHGPAPGLAAGPVVASSPDGREARFDTVRLRPAWSSHWLRLTPAVHVEIEGPLLSANGVVTLGDTPGFEGELSNVDLERLPLASLVQGTQLEGRADAQVAVAMGENGAVGPVDLVAREGSLGHPDLPLAIPYEAIEGRLTLGGPHWLAIESLDVRSPLVTGDLAGTIGHPPQQHLDLRMAFVAIGPVQGMLRQQGIQPDAQGNVELHLTGTLARPVVR